MITSICRQLVVLLPVAWLLARTGQRIGNDNLVWLSFPIAEAVSLTLSLFLFSRVNKNIISKVGDVKAA